MTRRHGDDEGDPRRPRPEAGARNARPSAPTGGSPAPLDASGLRALQSTVGNATTSALVAHASSAVPAAATPGRAAAGKGTRTEEGLVGKHAVVQRGLFDWIKGLFTEGPRTSQAVSISTVHGPKDTGRGGFEWKVWFSLAAAAANAGWVIQEVSVTKSSGATYHFWEAWEVEKGKKVTVWQDKGLDDNDDLYYMPPQTAGTKGSIVVKGKVKFYEGPLPADFVKNNASTLAGILHSTTSKPSFWDGSGTAHDITSVWDDTVAPPTHRVDATAGGTTLVGTP